LGGPNIGAQLGLAYHELLVQFYPETTGLTDLVAFFFRRVFELLGEDGAFGLIAKSKILQGDSRSSALEQITKADAQIFFALRRYRWPGTAAVNVCIVCVTKSKRATEVILDGKRADRISAFILEGSVDSMPAPLIANRGVCFQGTKVWGAGFVFEENPSGASSSLLDMESLLTQDPKCREVICPYIGGEEFNTSPSLRPRRYVVDFGDRSATEAQKWPLLFALVEERVRPVRIRNKQRNYRENWWLHANRVEGAGSYSRQYGRLIGLSQT
jgi:hypothetical protein